MEVCSNIGVRDQVDKAISLDAESVGFKSQRPLGSCVKSLHCGCTLAGKARTKTEKDPYLNNIASLGARWKLI